MINDAYTFSFMIRVHDGLLFTDRIFTLTIAQSSLTSPPVWQTGADLGTIVKFEPVSIQLLATDADGGPRPIKYYLTVTSGDGLVELATSFDNGTMTFDNNTTKTSDDTLPDGLILDEDTGEIYGAFNGSITDGTLENNTTFDNNATTFDNNKTTTETSSGVFEIQIFAVDGAHVVSKTFILTILNVPENAPVEWITPSSNIGTIKALTYGSFTVVANDPDSSPTPIKYTLVSGELPTSMFLNSNTGDISGMPANINEQEKYSVFGIEASDGISSR